MSARTTRLLVLGTVRRIEPATGYDVQSSLFGMAADRWAGLRSGSIYAMLRSLGRDDAIRAAEGEPVRHVTTATGREQHDALLLRALRSLPETGDTAELRAALHFADLLPLDAVRAALAERLREIDGALGDISARLDAAGPDRGTLFVTHGAGLEHALLRSQSEWLRELLDEALPESAVPRSAVAARSGDV